MSLKDSRIKIRSTFREIQHELHPNKIIRNYTPDELYKVIKSVIETGIVGETLPINVDYLELIHVAFAEEIEILKYHKIYDEKIIILTALAEDINKPENVTPFNYDFISDRYIETYHNVGKFSALDFKKRIQAFIIEEGIELSVFKDYNFDHLCEIIETKIDFIDNSNDTSSKCEKVITEKVIKKQEEESIDIQSINIIDLIIDTCNEEDLRKVLNSVNVEYGWIFLQKSSGLKGIVTGYGVNTDNDRMFLVITLEDGTISRPYSDNLDDWYSIIKDYESFDKLIREFKGYNPEVNVRLENQTLSFIYYKESKSILGIDLSDKDVAIHYQNTKKRSIKKAWKAMVNNWNYNITLQEIKDILLDNNIDLVEYSPE